MNCRKHNDCDAIGMCVSCGKLVCSQCVQADSHVIICLECPSQVNSDQMSGKQIFLAILSVILFVASLMLLLLSVIMAGEDEFKRSLWGVSLLLIVWLQNIFGFIFSVYSLNKSRSCDDANAAFSKVLAYLFFMTAGAIIVIVMIIMA